MAIKAILILGIFLQSMAWDNGLALTPTMGWNSYYHFGDNISEDLIKRIADAMDTNGMKDAGYNYIVLDDAWMADTRDGSGNLQADPAKFPSGMKALGDYLHSKGFKFGIYEDRGTATCYGLPGSYGHETEDAALFASWGVDFVKIDNCAAVGNLQTVYTAWKTAIQASGRPMVYNICAWGFPGAWVMDVAHSWRTFGDLWDGWDRIIQVVDVNAKLAAYAGPGHWNDPDILQVGRGGMTWDQYRAHFSLWAIMAAPLIASGEMWNLSAEAKSILLNTEVIAVNQDSLGIQGTRVRVDGLQEVWSKQLKDNSRAVLLFNRDIRSAVISVFWNETGLPEDNTLVRDLWEHADKGVFSKSYTAAVPGTGVVMLRVTSTSGGVVDTEPPAEPVILSATVLPPGNRVGLSWSHSSDNTNVAGYRIYKDGIQAASTTDTVCIIEEMEWNTQSLFSVRAQDPAGNLSDSLNAVEVMTGSEPSDFVYLSDLNWVSATAGWGTPAEDKSIEGNPIKLGGITYSKGIGTHAVSEIVYALDGAYEQFACYVGVDDEKNGGSVNFTVYADNIKKYESPVLSGWSAPQAVGIDVTGVDTLKLVAGDGGNSIDSDHADWADARLIRTGTSVSQQLPENRPVAGRLLLQAAHPFNQRIVFKYQLAAETKVCLRVYNLTGQLIKTLVDRRLGAGVYNWAWDGSMQSGGVYIIRLATGGKTFCQRVVLVK
jgi:alpha-galactosidase